MATSPFDGLEDLWRKFQADLQGATDMAALRELENRYLGKKNGSLKALRRDLGRLSEDERKVLAPRIESLKAQMEGAITNRRTEQEGARVAARERLERIDVTIPATGAGIGSPHAVSLLEARCIEMLRSFGFETDDGPEAESAYYNFDALNVPPDHPARDLQDTFWLDNGLLLRSHTTPIQARALERRPSLPLKVIATGRVYRNEAVDATHLAMFHQLEGFWVDHGVTFAQMKRVLASLVEGLFGSRRYRFKPKFYPYTEPSVGLDLACINCEGRGCGSCHDVGWVTVIGAGMIHPKVLREFGYDPEEVSGFAFGWGTTRLAYQWLELAKVKDLYSVNLDDLSYYADVALTSTDLG